MKHPIARYLMSAYAYYVQDDPLITDMEFDKLAKHNYDEIEHMHKHLVTIDNLDAGTYLGEYPERVKNAVSHYRMIMRRRPTPYIQWEIEDASEE